MRHVQASVAVLKGMTVERALISATYWKVGADFRSDFNQIERAFIMLMSAVAVI